MIKTRIILRRFIARYLSRLVRILYKIKFAFISFNKLPPIIILTPGKVGSSSVYYTLQKKVSNNVFHIHNLSSKRILESKKKHLNSDRKSIPLHLIISNLLRKKLLKYQGKLYIITIVREPISREISSFFQNTEFYKNQLENKNLEISKNKSKELLINIFKKDICQNLENWFNDEIKENFNVDVFKKDFHDKNYLIFKKGRFNILLLKMETMNQAFPEAIQFFLSVNSPIKIENRNVGGNKYYAEYYKEISEQFKIEKSVMKNILNSRYFHQFYSVEKESVINKWSK